MDRKQKSKRRLKCIAAILAAILFVLAVVWTKDYDKGTDNTYKIVCLGDSNLGNARNCLGTIALLEAKIGQPILNGAFGGSMMTDITGKKTEYYSALSMYQIAVSICNNNFGVQKSAIDTLARTNYLNYFEDGMEQLAKVDFDEVEILIIEHGVNDYLSGIPVDNGRDPYDTDTFCGTIRTVITMLQKEYPNLRIILVTPAYCAPVSGNGEYRPCDTFDYGGGYLEDYVNAEIEVAKEMNVEVIDLYHELEINEENISTYLYDGLHFSEYGMEVLAEFLGDYLLGETE